MDGKRADAAVGSPPRESADPTLRGPERPAATAAGPASGRSVGNPAAGITSSRAIRRDSKCLPPSLQAAGRTDIIASMDRRPVGHILLVTPDPATRQRWLEAMLGAECCVWSDPAELPDDVSLESLHVVICHGRLPSALRERFWATAEKPEAAQTCPPALVLVGTDGMADVRLPADADPAVLRMACRLLAELVHCRRRQLAGEQTCQRLAEAAVTDPLTGLPNRRAWELVLEQPPAVSSGKRVGLAIVDLDHFKQINDRYGYRQGDRVLQAAAAAVAHSVRSDDFLARLGGDEFILRLAVPDEAAARAIVERVREAIPRRLAEENLPQVSASAGLALCTATTRCTSETMQQLFSAADAAVRRAKHQGRNRTEQAQGPWSEPP